MPSICNIPILRGGRPYASVESVELVHHATGELVATVSQANSGLITRDVGRIDDRVLERFTVAELLQLCHHAADRFMTAVLPLGDDRQTFDDYARQLSATTGMPIAFCRANAEKIHHVLTNMEGIIRGLTHGLDPSILDRGYGRQHDGMVSYFRAGRIFGAVLPSNSPGVHALWLPAIALKTPIVLKPGREEPWTPFRIIQSFIAAGAPPAAFGFYPTDHGGAAELLRVVDRAMLFGDETTTRPWRNDPRIELHGPGFSKVLLADDCADEWERYLDVMVSSIAANGGRSCVNASGIWTPRHGRAIAEALADRLAQIEAFPAEDPRATIAAFANAAAAERISQVIDQGLLEPGAVDLTEVRRGSPRLASRGLRAKSHEATKVQATKAGAGTRHEGNLRNSGLDSCAYLLPTIIWCEDIEHPLANREFLFPYASVVECPADRMPDAVGRTLVASVITRDHSPASLAARLMASANVDHLNVGTIPTWKVSWDQPHEGNLFEHLYRQRAFQIEPALPAESAA